MAKSRNDLEVWTPRQIRRAGVVSRTAALDQDEVIDRFGTRCTSPERTAVDLARYVAGDEGIAAMDQCLRSIDRRPPITTPERVTAYLDSRPTWRASRVRAVLAEADGRAQSPWETFSRLALHRAGLTRFVPQVPVLGGTYVLDLADEEFKVGVEYDGAYHRAPTQHAADVERWNTLRYDLGWELILVTAGPLMNDRARLLRRVRAALAARDGTVQLLTAVVVSRNVRRTRPFGLRLLLVTGAADLAGEALVGVGRYPAT